MKSNNQINVPQAREAMDKFKMQAAQEVGVNLQSGYNGHLTSREAGSVGGQMVKKSPIRTMKFNHLKTNKTIEDYKKENKRLRMEVELMRDFLQSTERKCGLRQSMLSSIVTGTNIRYLLCAAFFQYAYEIKHIVILRYLR